MKIAIMISLFLPKWIGGTETATYNIAKYLAKNGHEVHIITSLDEGLPNISIENNFFIHRVFWKRTYKTGPIGFTLRLIYYKFFLIRMFLKIKEINPDIVHSQSMWTSIPGYMAKKVLKKPYVLYCRGSDVYLSAMPLKLIEKKMIKNADAVIGLTDDMKRVIQKKYDRDVFVIPNGIDVLKFKNNSKHKSASESRLILYVGRLHPVKGIKYLIQSMTKIIERNPNAKLLIVGEGEDKNKLVQLVRDLNLSDYISFKEHVLNDEIPQIMSSADIFVLPSLSESFGIVLIEAMACGLPIVATNVGGIPSIVKDNINGFLVDTKNSDMISEKVLCLLNNYSLMHGIAETNKKSALKYNWSNTAKSLEDVYNNCYTT